VIDNAQETVLTTVVRGDSFFGILKGFGALLACLIAIGTLFNNKQGKIALQEKSLI
jgi:hypothetical protein